jgi:hypothetical protein
VKEHITGPAFTELNRFVKAYDCRAKKHVLTPPHGGAGVRFSVCVPARSRPWAAKALTLMLPACADKTKKSAPVFVLFTVTRAAQQAFRTAKAAGLPPPTVAPKQKRARTSY